MFTDAFTGKQTLYKPKRKSQNQLQIGKEHQEQSMSFDKMKSLMQTAMKAQQRASQNMSQLDDSQPLRETKGLKGQPMNIDLQQMSAASTAWFKQRDEILEKHGEVAARKFVEENPPPRDELDDLTQNIKPQDLPGL